MIKTLAFGAISTLALVFAVHAQAAVVPVPTTIVVSPGHMEGWVFVNDQTDGPGSGTIANGPLTPPLGTGSVRFTTTGPSDGQIVELPRFKGMKLSDISVLKYSTAQELSNTSTVTALALQFNIDKDVTDADNSFQGRMVYEPYYNNGGTVPRGQWKQWDAKNDGNGLWWFSKSLTKFGGNCPQSAPCTWSHILALYPNIGIHPTLGAIVLKAGSGWSGVFKGAVDAVTIGNSQHTVIYNFEPLPTLPKQ